ncbi:MAG: transcriptional regulator [Allomuricauda sp.]
MIAVLTGDIKNSTGYEVPKWMPLLKQALNRYGKEPKQWEIYRGDSFQLAVSPEKALEAAIYIKACIKQKRGMDVRMGIGLGEKEYSAEKITESNGSAFILSGECFENLKKQTLAVKSNSEIFDTQINLMLQLASLTMDSWLPVASKVVKTAMEHPKANQKELGVLLDKSQSNISEALIRAGFDEVQKMMQFYSTQLAQL